MLRELLDSPEYLCTMMEHIRRPPTIPSPSFRLVPFALSSFSPFRPLFLPRRLFCSAKRKLRIMLARGREMQRDGLEAGGTGTMLLDSKILARLAGADERLFHRTLSLRRRPATTRMSTTTTPIWVRSLHSALSHPLSPSSLWSLLSIRPSSFPLLSFVFYASFTIISADWWQYVPPKLLAFPPLLGASQVYRDVSCIFFFYRFAKQRHGNRL